MNESCKSTAPPVAFDLSRWTPEDQERLSRLMTDFFSGKTPDPVRSFEERLGALFGRRHTLAVSSSTLALFLALKGLGIGPADEVILSPLSWYQIGRAVEFCGATSVFADIDPWSFTLDPRKVEARVTERTRVILGGNTLGHPADWGALRSVAANRGLVLIEDATESFFCEYDGRMSGTLGDLSILHFGSPHPSRGESGSAIMTDREDLYESFRALRSRPLSDRFSLNRTAWPSMEAGMGPVQGILCDIALSSLPWDLKRKGRILSDYRSRMASFEGVKDLYRSPMVGMMNSFLYMVHLGTRFSKSSRDAMLKDLSREGIEAHPYCQPLHLERLYVEKGYRKGLAPIAEKLADRAIALPSHPGLGPEEVERIVSVLKDASLNVGAGAAIY